MVPVDFIPLYGGDMVNKLLAEPRWLPIEVSSGDEVPLDARLKLRVVITG